MARETRGEALASEFLKSMAALGYSAEQTIGLLQKAQLKEVECNGCNA